MSSDEMDESERGSARQVDDVSFHEIGQRLIDLGEQLRKIGTHTENPDLRKTLMYGSLGESISEIEEEQRFLDGMIRRTLGELNGFRRDYANWERIIVEFALTKRNMTQRDVARLLGVGLSTVNRWAQHPLTYDED